MMSEVRQAGGSETVASDEIRAAQDLLKQDRRRGLAALNEIFRNGRVPDPHLEGPYKGELVAADVAPGVTQLIGWLTSFWMPWQGKYLISSESKGDNIFSQGSRIAMRALFPLYKGIKTSEGGAFRAFVFKTSVAPGMIDPDRQVLRIDYDLPDNPSLTIRRIVDEVVQVHDDMYLGKIHFKWWWGRWQMIGYFSLRRSA